MNSPLRNGKAQNTPLSARTRRRNPQGLLLHLRLVRHSFVDSAQTVVGVLSSARSDSLLHAGERAAPEK